MSTTRFYAKPLIEWGVASRALPGQPQSGDLHIVKSLSNGALVAVVDGLGHGDEATVAARLAIGVLNQKAEESVISLILHCHEALMSSRGAAMTVISFNGRDSTITCLGVGNVEAALLRADASANPPRESVLLRGGVVGYQLPALYASVFPVQRGDTLVVTTDGIQPGAADRLTAGAAPQTLADRILAEKFKGTDDALVLAVRYLGPRL